MYGWVNLSTFSSYSILPYWLADTCTVDQQSTRSFKACKRETHISRFAWIDMKSTFVLCDTECEVTKIKTLTDSITWDEENTSSWIPDYVYFGGRSLSVLYTHTHTHTHHLWYVVLSIWAMFQSSRKSSPGCHVTLWSIMKASSWSLTPIIPTDHHSHDTLPTLHWPCLYMCVCVGYMFVLVMERKSAVFRLTSIVLLATDRMMMKMKLICADNKEETSSRPFMHKYHRRRQMVMNITKDKSCYVRNHYPSAQLQI